MPRPAKPAVPPPPLRSNPESFSARMEASLLFWEIFATYLDELGQFAEAQASAALAAAAGGDLPPLTDQAGKFLRVKTDGSGVEFKKAMALADSADAAELALTAPGRALMTAATPAAQAALLGLGGMTGSVLAFATATTPAGWLKANGAAVSRSTYAGLFAVIGTTYGAGNGSTTFNLPDLRGEFIRGLDEGRGVDPGRVLGSAQADDNKAHSHTGSTVAAGEHNHTVTGGSGNGGSAFSGSASSGSKATSSAGEHSHALTIDSSGGGEARPRNVALVYYIKF